DIVYLGVMGAAWGENPERGVYKTSDGGKSWSKVLYIDEKTGVADLVMDPSNPNKLIAAMWEYRRWPWFFKSGGPGSGIYATLDGGENWQKRTAEDGLPDGELGRIGLAIAPSAPNIVYALVEAEKNALYGSKDGGFKWNKITDKNVSDRPFYYQDIFVDPTNENRVYHVHSRVSMSEDGGKTFKEIVPFSRVHPDHHAWWIHPQNPNLIMDGNDGGMAISRDRARTWRFVENLPLAQFYHINVDMETPYNVMGGMQDNGSWRGPNTVWRAGGIRNAYWEEVAFGDGFDVVPDHSDPRYGYAMSQGGNVRRYDLLTGEQKLIKPIHPDNIPLRFNWNAGIAHDPFNATTIYYGSQFLHKSTNRGDTWEIISPDLTTNDPEKQKQLDSGGLTYDVTQAENFTTIIAIAPSPVKEGVIWVGTDDGNVQLTQDGGQTWTNLSNKMKGVAEGSWVPQIHASSHAAGEAFVVFEDHRRNNWTPYVYHTTNFGNSWKRLVDENDVFGYALSIAQDPIEPGLLFLGTEFGLYVSIDAGENWTRWTNGFPTASTMDLVIHPRDHDLVIGTFGRAAYVLDDIRPLRALASNGTAVLEKPVHVFDVPDAILAIQKQAAGTRFAAEAEFKGEVRPSGALISFVYNPIEKDGGHATNGKAGVKKDTLDVEILDSDGEVIRTLKAAVTPGLNRTNWDLRRKGVRPPTRPESARPGRREPRGPEVLPGTYTVKISNGDQSASADISVKMDPRVEISEADLQTRDTMMKRVMSNTEIATQAADRLREAKKTIGIINGRIKDRKDENIEALRKQGKDLQKSIKSLLEGMNGKEVQGIRRDPSTVSSRLRSAMSYLRSALQAPGETERIAVEQAEASLNVVLAKINSFFDKDWLA
ncbi:MAG: WD40/YVTN/BNR-like repeat-containing protein, partial [bacterium]